MNLVEPLSFDGCIAALSRADPLMAFSKVPTGIHSYWGQSFDWPEWMLEGTGFAGSRQLPLEIRLVDDLRISANLLRHEGEERLMAMLLAWPHFPGERLLLSAPDLQSALPVLADMIGQRNPHIDALFAVEAERGVLRLRFAPLLRPLHPFHEAVMLSLMFLCVRAFVGIGATSSSDLARIELATCHAGALLGRMLPCAISQTSGETFVAIPGDLLERGGLGSDPDAWRQTVAATAVGPASRTVPLPVEARAIEGAIMLALRKHARVPQLSEIARARNTSERSLSRVLAQEGLSYRQIVDGIRMTMAMQLLLDGRMSVGEISERLGYSDDSAFVRSFRRRFSISPARWRSLRLDFEQKRNAIQ